MWRGFLNQVKQMEDVLFEMLILRLRKSNFKQKSYQIHGYFREKNYKIGQDILPEDKPIG